MKTGLLSIVLVSLGLSASAFVGQQRPCSVARPISRFVPLRQAKSTSLVLRSAGKESEGFDLPPMLDPGTKGGAMVTTSLLGLIPVVTYYSLTGIFGFEETVAGPLASGSFVVISIVLWTASYMFRVANKDMTYAKQLKDYEDAVIAKRLEELAEDEVEALMSEMDPASTAP